MPKALPGVTDRPGRSPVAADAGRIDMLPDMLLSVAERHFRSPRAQLWADYGPRRSSWQN
jgi:hypothetical protein